MSATTADAYSCQQPPVHDCRWTRFPSYHDNLCRLASPIIANAISTSTVTVQAKDANGNNLTANGGTVTLSSSAGTLSAVTANGEWHLHRHADLAHDWSVPPPSLAPLPALRSPQLHPPSAFIAGPASPAITTITATPSPIVANGITTSTVTVQAKDANGNNLTANGGTVTLSVLPAS